MRDGRELKLIDFFWALPPTYKLYTNHLPLPYILMACFFLSDIFQNTLSHHDGSDAIIS